MSRPSSIHGKCPDCGHNGCLATYQDGGTYCFSCLRTTSGEDDVQESMFTVPDIPMENSTVRFPTGLSDKFPVKQQRWLLINGIDHHIRSKYHIYYIRKGEIERQDNKPLKIKDGILLPVFKNSSLSFYQIRFLGQTGPWKYLTVGPHHLAMYGNEQSDTLVLTEDILSAIRIVEAIPTIRAGALVGLGYKQEQLLLECKKYKQVIIWLDGDDAGIKAADKLERRLKLYTNVVKVQSSLEAKECYNSEIRERLQVLSPTKS